MAPYIERLIMKKEERLEGSPWSGEVDTVPIEDVLIVSLELWRISNSANEGYALHLLTALLRFGPFSFTGGVMSLRRTDSLLG